MSMLSKYISESEFTVTQVRGVNNSLPVGTIKNNAIILCENYLDIIRAYYNKPLIITSGYRSPEVNKAVGGSMGASEKAQIKGYMKRLKIKHGLLINFQQPKKEGKAQLEIREIKI